MKAAIVFESSDLFVPYLHVALQSLVDKTSENHCYDIIILSDEIDDDNKEILSRLCKNKNNISIRFFDPTLIVKKYIERSRYNYLRLNYYRLSLPWILKDYKMALNLGADIIIERDVYELVNQELLEQNYIGGGIDLGYQGRLNMDIPKDELNKKDSFLYVNADVLLFDLERIRRNFRQDDIMEIWQEKQFRCAEQDVLNIVFDGHIQLLDLKWNVFPKRMSSTEHILNAPKKSVDLWKKALEDPYIIHYAAFPKPWSYPLVGYGDKWWEYARKSPYYEEIIRRMCLEATRSDKEMNLLYKAVNRICPQGTIRRKILKAIYLKAK